jgi:hypothetical protein
VVKADSGVVTASPKRTGAKAKAAIARTANIHRRQLNKGQRAMAVAFAYPEPDKRGRGNKGKCEDSAGFSQRRLEQARQVLGHSKELAKRVLDGELGQYGQRPPKAG